MPADQRLGVLERRRQRRHGRTIGDVAEGYANIPKQPGAAGPPDGALAKPGPEGGVIEGQELLESRPRLDGWAEGLDRLGIGKGRPCAGIDRTDLLAEIAAENPVADQGPHLARDRSPMLDRPEGNTATVVEHAGGDQCAGGTDPKTGIAAATRLLDGLIVIELGRGDDLAQQDLRSSSRHQQIRVLSQPSDPGAGGGRAVEHPAVVDVALGAMPLLSEHGEERLHPLEQNLVIVATERVGGDPATGALGTPSRTLPARGRDHRWDWVRERQGDDAAGVGRISPWLGAGVRAGLAPPGEPVHQALSGAAGRRRRLLAERLRAGHANRAKSELSGALFEGVGQRHFGSSLGAWSGVRIIGNAGESSLG